MRAHGCTQESKSNVLEETIERFDNNLTTSWQQFDNNLTKNVKNWKFLHGKWAIFPRNFSTHVQSTVPSAHKLHNVGSFCSRRPWKSKFACPGQAVQHCEDALNVTVQKRLWVYTSTTKRTDRMYIHIVTVTVIVTYGCLGRFTANFYAAFVSNS